MGPVKTGKTQEPDYVKLSNGVLLPMVRRAAAAGSAPRSRGVGGWSASRTGSLSHRTSIGPPLAL